MYLRRHRVEDAAGIAAAVAGSMAELRPWMPWAADNSIVEPDVQRQRLVKVAPNWELGSEYVYLVFRPDGNDVLGCIALLRQVGPAALEIGYWLRTTESGRGTMTEATRALTNEALRLPGVDRVEIHCDEANYKSAAIPRRLGFSLVRVEARDVTAPGQVGRGMVWVREQPVPATAVFYVVGHPGAGKYTTAKELQRLCAGRHEHLAVVDNHYITNPIFGVINVDGRSPLPPSVWDRAAEVAEAVYKAIETISPWDWSFVFTNFLSQDEPQDWRLYQRVKRLAAARGSRFLLVRLMCDTEELCHRVTGPTERSASNWSIPGGLANWQRRSRCCCQTTLTSSLSTSPTRARSERPKPYSTRSTGSTGPTASRP